MATSQVSHIVGQMNDSMLQSHTETLQPINLLVGNYNCLNEQLEETLCGHSR